MPILNYTTDVDEFRTIGEIQGILSSKGAREISVQYDAEGRAQAVAFSMLIDGAPLYFRLPRNVEGVLAVMLEQYNRPGKRKHTGRPTSEQAARVSWRILKDWVEAQLALIESRQADAAQAFLPYAVDKNGETFYQMFLTQRRATLQLAAGAPTEEI